MQACVKVKSHREKAINSLELAMLHFTKIKNNMKKRWRNLSSKMQA